MACQRTKELLSELGDWNRQSIHESEKIQCQLKCNRLQDFVIYCQDTNVSLNEIEALIQRGIACCDECERYISSIVGTFPWSPKTEKVVDRTNKGESDTENNNNDVSQASPAGLKLHLTEYFSKGSCLNITTNAQGLRSPECLSSAFFDANRRYSNVQENAVALIFDNKNYKDNPRDFTHIDRVKLKNLWEKFGFHVQVLVDKSQVEIEQALDNVAQKKNPAPTCVVCCFLGHGVDEMTVRTVRDEHMNVFDDMVLRFSEEKCPHLDDVPRIFLFQTCREGMHISASLPDFRAATENTQTVVHSSSSPLLPLPGPSDAIESTSASEDHDPSACVVAADVVPGNDENATAGENLEPSPCVVADDVAPAVMYDANAPPNTPDANFTASNGAACKAAKECKYKGAEAYMKQNRHFFIGWATMPGEVAARYPECGSCFINCFCSRIDNNLSRKSPKTFSELFNKAAINARSQSQRRDPQLPRGQLAVCYSSLAKLLYFVPRS